MASIFPAKKIDFDNFGFAKKQRLGLSSISYIKGSLINVHVLEREMFVNSRLAAT